MSEDDFIYWQDALDHVMAGRGGDVKCPFCYEGAVQVTKVERTTRLECQRCHHYIEGRFSNDPDSL